MEKVRGIGRSGERKGGKEGVVEDMGKGRSGESEGKRKKWGRIEGEKEVWEVRGEEGEREGEVPTSEQD